MKEENVACIGNEDQKIFEKIVNYLFDEVCIEASKTNDTQFTDFVGEIGTDLSESLHDALKNIKEKVNDGTQKIFGWKPFCIILWGLKWIIKLWNLLTHPVARMKRGMTGREEGNKEGCKEGMINGWKEECRIDGE